jgi:hypothetical protein
LRLGLDLFDDPVCPFCENDWDLEALRTQVQARLAEAKEATEIKEMLEKAAAPLTTAMQGLEALAVTVAGYSKNLSTHVVTTDLIQWTESLRKRRANVFSLEDLGTTIAECSVEYRQIPDAAGQVINNIHSAVNALPESV